MRLAATVWLAASCLTASAVWAAEPGWTQREGVALRLVAGAAQLRAGGSTLIGLDVRVEPGWKFFWRAPGRFGIAPEFDWSQSHNLGGFVVHWPVPRWVKLGEVDVPAWVAGYDSDVLVPITARRAAPGPASAGLSLDYGVCRDVCIADVVELRVEMPASSSGDELQRARLNHALNNVPGPAARSNVFFERPRVDAATGELVVVVRAERSLVRAEAFFDGPVVFERARIVPVGDGTEIRAMLPPSTTLPAGARISIVLADGDLAVEELLFLP